MMAHWCFCRATAVSGLLATLSFPAAALEVEFADPAWNGEEIPAGQQCQRFDGEDPETPRLRVSELPEGSEAVVLEFSDRDVSRMDDGGHGKVGYRLESEADTIELPSVPGHSETLPEPFFVVAMHGAPGWDEAGAYLPPCSGGGGNQYAVDVKAVTLQEDDQVDRVLDESSLTLGRY